MVDKWHEPQSEQGRELTDKQPGQATAAITDTPNTTTNAPQPTDAPNTAYTLPPSPNHNYNFNTMAVGGQNGEDELHREILDMGSVERTGMDIDVPMPNPPSEEHAMEVDGDYSDFSGTNIVLGYILCLCDTSTCSAKQDVLATYTKDNSTTRPLDDLLPNMPYMKDIAHDPC